MSAYISQYLDHILSWAESGHRVRGKSKWRSMQSSVRARTPRELVAARRRRSRRRRLQRGRHREWNAATGGVLMLSRAAFPWRRLSWRLASSVIVLLCGLLLAYIMSNIAYFADAINLSGADFVPGEEIFRAAGVEGENILWIDPGEVAGRIEQIPGILDAEVDIQFPDTVNVQVVEHEPVMMWRQGGESVWVDDQGETFPARLDLPWLLPITVDDVVTPIETAIPIDVVMGATLLKALRPNIELLHYDTAHGLSYQDGRNWRGYFGTGDSMAQKLMVYETLVAELERTGINPTAIYVADLETSYYVD